MVTQYITNLYLQNQFKQTKLKMEIINQEQQQSSTQQQKPDDKRKQHRSVTGNGRMVGGGILIFIGILVLLANFNLIEGNIGPYLFSWKTILIVIGLIIIGAKENKTSGYILIGIGTIFWLPTLLGNYYITLGEVFWPMILIGIGLLLIVRQRNKVLRFSHVQHGNATDSRNGYLNDVSIFGGGIKIIQSKNFKGGDITAIFGGSEFDLRNVEINTEGAAIDMFTLFGGTKFIVPEDWNVYSDAVSILGGFSDKRSIKRTDEARNKTLFIKGVIILGGVEVKSF